MTLVMGAVLLVVPRRWAMVPFLIAAVLIPPDQALLIAGLNFNMMRVLIIIAFSRAAIRGELRALHLHRFDLLLLGFLLWSFAATTILYGTFARFVNQLGVSMDVIGVYFFARIALRSWSDIVTTIRGAVVCSVPLAFFMGIERATGHNLFSNLGGVPAMTVVRENGLRCQGAFSHPIMAGLFGACWVPFFTWLWWARRERAWSAAGLAASLVIVGTAASSTPVSAVMVAVFGMALWQFRRYLRLLRWSFVALLVALQLMMHKPIWHLIARVDLVGGSTGWHRYWVIQAAVLHFREWWLLGIIDVTPWDIWWNDITNEYVLAAINGGLGAVILLVATHVVGFQGAGRAAKNRALSLSQRRLAWTGGVTLFVHVTSFLGVSYFGQMRYILLMQLAMLGAIIAFSQRATVGLARRRVAVPGSKRPGVAAASAAMSAGGTWKPHLGP
jgi:hypothetical protein